MLDVGGEQRGLPQEVQRPRDGSRHRRERPRSGQRPEEARVEHQVDAGKATIGIGMGKAMYEWIKAAFDKGYETKDGAS